MTNKFAYEHAYSWWHYVNNIAKAKNYINNITPPQRAQQPSGTLQDSTHGDADIGPMRRRVYFDLGGEYDLMDDHGYAKLREEILAGNVVGARILTPREIGFSHKVRGTS